jgi:3-methyladenine DNA glycosylase/8-oxoguanine DNA glycosylase
MSDPAGPAPLRVDARGTFDHAAALATLAAHAVEGLHHLDLAAGTLTRWVDVDGTAHLVTVRLDAGGASLATPSQDPAVHTALRALVTHWFDLEADLAPVDDRLGADPLFAAQVRERPGLRITRFRPPFEAVICTVLGQQVSLAAGRLFAARLVAAYGEVPTADGTGLRGIFPSPDALAAVPTEELRAAVGLTGSRARTVHEAAVLCAEHGGGAELPERATLAGVHGIGVWTLDHLALRAGTDTDAFPASDAVLRRTLAALAPGAGPERIASWKPVSGLCRGAAVGLRTLTGERPRPPPGAEPGRRLLRAQRSSGPGRLSAERSSRRMSTT